MASPEELESAIKNAEKLHGHLGPFLVIGVKMGNVAKKVLSHGKAKHVHLRVTARVPFTPPFSCVLDGIQATTQCTVGNQGLQIEQSTEEITAHFIADKKGDQLKVTVYQKVVDELKEKIAEGVSSEELAWKIARTPENQLFALERQREGESR